MREVGVVVVDPDQHELMNNEDLLLLLPLVAELKTSTHISKTAWAKYPRSQHNQKELISIAYSSFP